MTLIRQNGQSEVSTAGKGVASAGHRKAQREDTIQSDRFPDQADYEMAFP
jgi:hypothetical protein